MGLIGCLQWCFLFLSLLHVCILAGFIEDIIVPLLTRSVVPVQVTFWREGINPVYLRNVRVRDDSSSPWLPDLVNADVIRIHWQLPWFRSGRALLPEMELRNVLVHLHGEDPTHTNYGFLIKGQGNSPPASDRSFPSPLPERVSVVSLAVQAEMADWSAQVAGIHAHIQGQSLEKFSLDMESDEVTAGWRGFHAGMPVPFPKGYTKLHVQRDGSAFTVTTDIDLPDFLVIQGKASITGGEILSFETSLEDLRVSGPVFSEFSTLVLPVPAGFSELRVAPLNLRGHYSYRTLKLDDSSVDVHISDLRIGEDSALWYAGDLALKAEGIQGQEDEARFTATLNQGQEVKGSVHNAASGPTLAAEFSDWNRNDVLALWPGALDGWRSYLNGLEQVGGVISCAAAPSGVLFNVALSPKLRNGITSRLNSEGSYTVGDGIHVSGTLGIGTGEAAFNGVYQSENEIRLDGKLQAFPVEALSPLFWPEAPLDADFKVSGTFHVGGDAGKAYPFRTELTAASGRYGQWQVPEAMGPLALNVQGAIQPDFSALDLTAIGLTLGESAVVTLEKSVFDMSRKSLRGQITGAADMEPVGQLAGVEGLWGRVEWGGPIAFTQNTRLELSSLDLLLEPLGYEGYSLPYGQPLRVNTTAVLDLNSYALELSRLHAALGENTTVETEKATLSQSGVSIPGVLTFKTDFAPFVAKRYLSSARGFLQMKLEDFIFGTGKLSGALTYECMAEQLALPDTLANLSGVSVKGEARLGDDLSGRGTAAIETIETAGIRVNSLSGTIIARSNHFIIEDIAFGLFGGKVHSQAEIYPLDTDIPVQFSGHVQDIDLAVFTEEFKPESLVLTGKVAGDISVGMNMSKLTRLDVDLEAGDNFSVNRDMVEQLLMRQYMQEISGGRRIERMVQSVIGKEAQRKFDFARAVLGLEDERISGYIQLGSDKLNLTVDVKADPPALLEALRIRQQ